MTGQLTRGLACSSGGAAGSGTDVDWWQWACYAIRMCNFTAPLSALNPVPLGTDEFVSNDDNEVCEEKNKLAEHI